MEYSYCVSCGQKVTYRFAICANCEGVYGSSALGWPDWIRLTWNADQRERRSNIKNAEHTFPIEYVDDIELSDDGLNYMLSNKNPRHLENNYILQDSILSVLKAPMFICIYYYYFVGLTQQEIADILGVTRQCVYSRLRTAEQKLRTALGGAL